MKKTLTALISLFISISTVYANEAISFSLNNETKLYLIKCPIGEFDMGSPKNELGRQKGDYDISKTIITNDFYIGKYEITQAQYQAIIGENPSKNQDKEKPVERVNYFDAIDFCKKLNQLTESTRPTGYEFTLPTEIQWEYACRAGTNAALNNGKQLSNSKGNSEELDDIAWYKSNSEMKTHTVGMKRSNNWGIYDMHGNVAEWCLDAFNNNESTNVVNKDSKCAIRGGAYFYEPEKLRASSRGANSPNAISSGFGFRVALVNTSNNKAEKINQSINNITEVQNVLPEKDIKETDIQNNNPTDLPKPNNNTEDSIKVGVKISISVNGVKFPLMGCPNGEFIKRNPDNKILHKAIIEKGFYIGKYEVTQGQYKAIMGNNPSIITGDKLPVHNINWLDASKFCKKLNELTTDKRPAGYEFSLPTEIQWEYACRSGYNTSLNNGKDLTNFNSSDNELNKLGWYDANSCEKIQTVGKKIANAWGIHDMLGNTWEFCCDNIPSESNKNTNHRIIRGGGYKSKAEKCTCLSRNIIKESETNEELGFRIILKPIDK